MKKKINLKTEEVQKIIQSLEFCLSTIEIESSCVAAPSVAELLTRGDNIKKSVQNLMIIINNLKGVIE
jgi:hypothetical protein